METLPGWWGRPKHHGAAATLALLLGSPALAQPLTFTEALAIAEQQAPSLEAEANSISAARSAAVAAGRLPDPRLVLGIENLPVSGPPAWTLDEEAMTMGRVGVMQEMPNLAKRRAEVELADASISRAEAGSAIERLRVRRETAQAWLARYHLERKVALLNELERENLLLADGVNAQLAAGEVSAPDTVMPKQEAAMLADRRDELALEISRSKAALRRWVGDAADAPIAGDPPQFPIDHEHLRHRLDRHPELAAYDSASAMAQAAVHEAEADKQPDWGMEVGYGRRDPDFGDMVSVLVSVDLPLFAGARQDPRIAARHAELNRIDAERKAMLREHSEELESQIAEHDRIVRAIERQQQRFIPLAREKVDLTLSAYGAGNARLDQVLATRRELIEARMKVIDLDSRLAQLEARLHYAYGEDR